MGPTRAETALKASIPHRGFQVVLGSTGTPPETRPERRRCQSNHLSIYLSIYLCIHISIYTVLLGGGFASQWPSIYIPLRQNMPPQTAKLSLVLHAPESAPKPQPECGDLVTTVAVLFAYLNSSSLLGHSREILSTSSWGKL